MPFLWYRSFWQGRKRLWGEPLEFDRFDNTLHIFTIRWTVDKLSADEGSHYVEDYNNGQYWDCIASVVDNPVVWLHELKAEDWAHDQAGRLYLLHSGHKWDYWQKYVNLALAARELGFDTVLQPDVLATLEKIHDAFLPLLKPGITDQVLGIESPTGEG